MTVCARDIMKTAVRAVTPDMSLPDLEDFLISERISGAPVVRDGRVVGVVSRSDIVRMLSLERSLAGLIGEGSLDAGFSPGESMDDSVSLAPGVTRALDGQTVEDAMVAEPISVGPDIPVTDVAQLLIDRHMHRVLVTEAGALLGIITSLDIARLVADGRFRER